MPSNASEIGTFWKPPTTSAAAGVTDWNSIPVSSAIRESSSRMPGMSVPEGIAFASRKMSATSIGRVSSFF